MWQYCFLLIDISLRPVFDAHIAQSQWHFSLVEKQTSRICASVHDIDLSNAADCSFPLFIYAARHMQHFIICNILVCGNNAKDDRAWLLHILADHLRSDFMNISILPINGYSRQAWQINYCQVGAIRRINI